MKIKVQGYSGKNILRVFVEPTMCGTIADGIALHHGDDAGWVISFKDLERIYLAAKKSRKSK